MSTIYVVEGTREHSTIRTVGIFRAFRSAAEAAKVVSKANEELEQLKEHGHYRYYAVELDERT